ncbi:hypothetical protein MBLNU230_g4166t1 [Neophaeotheca triangularis]
MSASISCREHILWRPETEPHEPTDTLVLTAPSGRFVDTRVLKSAQYVPSPHDRLSPHHLDWAFAGTSVSTTLSDNPDINNGGPYRFTRWTHTLDSRSQDTTDLSDAGNMFPDPSAPSGEHRTLEIGAMVNPETGLMTEYEEVWRDFGPKAVVGEEGGKVQCLVLHFEGGGEEGDGVCGVVVRVGGFCQGVVRVGEQFALERWEVQGEEGRWVRKYRFGELWVPCAVVAREAQKVKEEGEVRYGDSIWKVVEKAEWEEGKEDS